MKWTNTTIKPMLFLLAALSISPVVDASDTDDLKQMLDNFLAGVTKAETHDRFWAEDLIYTSSSGTRTTKADIMSGFNAANNSPNEDAAGPVFTAEDVQIQVYGDAAVVAFRLLATPPVGAEELGVQNYFNTGTFLRRGGEWRVVAWQATIIPK